MLRSHHSRDEQSVTADRLAGWNAVHDLAVHHLPLRDVLDVDHGTGATDRDTLFDRADRQLRIDARRESGAELNALPDDAPEPGQAELHAIDPGDQRHDQVLSLAIGDRGSHLFDEGRTAHFNGDAWQRAAR